MKIYTCLISPFFHENLNKGKVPLEPDHARQDEYNKGFKGLTFYHQDVAQSHDMHQK